MESIIRSSSSARSSCGLVRSRSRRLGASSTGGGVKQRKAGSRRLENFTQLTSATSRQTGEREQDADDSAG